MRKSQIKKIIIISIVTFLYFCTFCAADNLKCSNETPTPVKICISLVDTILRPKILGNRIGILS